MKSSANHLKFCNCNNELMICFQILRQVQKYELIFDDINLSTCVHEFVSFHLIFPSQRVYSSLHKYIMCNIVKGATTRTPTLAPKTQGDLCTLVSLFPSTTMII